MWTVPLFDISYSTEEIEAVKNVLESGWLTMGDRTKKFENALAKYLNCKYAFVVSNGTAALHLALLALDIGRNDEVICPSLTFVAGSNTIIATGAKPVFADIESANYLCISSEDIEKKINAKTKAIQVMHYAGYPCEMDSILSVAEKNNLYVIEDAAHAIGSEYHEKKCGTIGDIGCFSFFSNKNLSVGEGGLVVTNNSKLAKRIELIRSHGMTTLTLDRNRGHAFTYDVIESGYNYRIDEMRSALGYFQLKRLDENNIKRQELVKYYIDQLSEIDMIDIPFQESSNSLLSFHIFPILLNKTIDRLKFMSALKRMNIQTSIHYPPIHKFSYYVQNKYRYSLPVTDEVEKRLVTLPLYPAMQMNDINYILESIKAFLID